MAAGSWYRTRGLVAGLVPALVLAKATLVHSQTQRYVVVLQRSQEEHSERRLVLKFSDSAAAASWLNQEISRLWKQGYLSIDAAWKETSPDSAQVHLIPTKRVTTYDVVMKGRLRRRTGTPATFYVREILPLLQKKENRGYPFARIIVDSLQWYKTKPRFFINIDQGPLIHMDTMDVTGSARVSRQFLETYLGLKPGSIYREKSVRSAMGKLERLPYASVAEKPTVYFHDSLARLRVRLNKKPCSTVYGFLGVAPASSFNPRLLIMGEARLNLHHALGYGEIIDLEWRRLQVQTQSLRFGVSWPYLLNTSVGAEGLFDFYRKDSSFQNIQLSVGVRYLFPGQNYVRFGFQRFISRLIDRKNPGSMTQLPPAHDATLNLAYIGVGWENTDNRLSPSQGWMFYGDISAGIRTIPRLPGIADSLYQRVPTQGPFWHAMIRAERYVPVGRMWVLRVNESGGLMAGNTLFQNQLFRLGGLRHLRGFNEESLFAASYVTWVVEPRLRFERNSFVCLFANGGYMRRFTNAGWLEDCPLGFGAGGALDTKAGLLELYYAYGMLRQQPLRLREAKIHVGYRVLF